MPSRMRRRREAPPCVAAPQVTFKKVKALEALGLGLREGLGFGGLEFRV